MCFVAAQAASALVSGDLLEQVMPAQGRDGLWVEVMGIIFICASAGDVFLSHTPLLPLDYSPDFR